VRDAVQQGAGEDAGSPMMGGVDLAGVWRDALTALVVGFATSPPPGVNATSHAVSPDQTG
jgi:hypothetical protein